MIFHGFDRPGVRTDYAAIGRAAMDPEAIPTEVTREEYWYKLECLPPIYVAGGFLVREANSDCAWGPVHAMYTERDGRFYAKWVVKGRPDTYIKNVAAHHPIDEEDKARLLEWV